MLFHCDITAGFGFVALIRNRFAAVKTLEKVLQQKGMHYAYA